MRIVLEGSWRSHSRFYCLLLYFLILCRILLKRTFLSGWNINIFCVKRPFFLLCKGKNNFCVANMAFSFVELCGDIADINAILKKYMYFCWDFLYNIDIGILIIWPKYWKTGRKCRNIDCNEGSYGDLGQTFRHVCPTSGVTGLCQGPEVQVNRANQWILTLQIRTTLSLIA